jgi:hypothetical protein
MCQIFLSVRVRVGLWLNPKLLIKLPIVQQLFGFGFAGNIPACFAANQIRGFFGHGPQCGGFAPDYRKQSLEIVSLLVIITVKGTANLLGVLGLLLLDQRS